MIKNDLYRFKADTSLISLIKALKYPGFRFIFFYRISNFDIFILSHMSKFLLRYYSYKFGFQIPSSTKIGTGFYIGHHGNIIINSKTVIGKNCNIAPLVTIGKTNRGSKKGTPKIGDFVWIGTGAVIVGAIKIGSNVLIAPNSYVNFDVPSDSIVIGNPAKIIADKNATKDYINNII